MKPVGGNSSKVRLVNCDLLVQSLRTHGAANISGLSHRTGLSIATCANILPELVESGMALELDKRESRGGRPARCYAFNPNHSSVACILLQCEKGKVRYRHSVVNAGSEECDAGLDTQPKFSTGRLDELIAVIRAKHPNLKAVAVSVPGVVDDAGKVEMSDIAELSGFPLEEHLRRTHALKAAVENDMNLAALGCQESLSPDTSLAYIALPRDKCPGSGLVVNGRLVKGMSNFAGEVGSIPFGKLPAKDGTALAGRLAAAIIAVVNPHMIVLSGEMVRESTADAVRAVCLRTVPPQHLPELVVRPEYGADCFAGMARVGLETLSCDVRLVETRSL